MEENIDAELKRKRDIVLEFINRKVEIKKKVEEVVVPVEEPVVMSEVLAVPENKQPDALISMLPAVEIAPILVVSNPEKPKNNDLTLTSSGPAKNAVKIRTATPATVSPKYAGPLICIVPKKDRTPRVVKKTLAPKKVPSKTKAVAEKHHHGLKRRSPQETRTFLEQIMEILN